MRQIVLDTETTGLAPEQGHRIIEIGAVEMIDRKLTGNNYQQYIKPQRQIDKGAQAVHGISNTFLDDKPVFAKISAELIQFLKGAELIIHNADFDVGFLNHEFKMLTPVPGKVESFCTIQDTLTLARKLHPGQKNTLDALCKRYKIDNFKRELHGALLDAQILAQVYLAMTGGQESLFGSGAGPQRQQRQTPMMTKQPSASSQNLRVIYADAEESGAHEAYMAKLREQISGQEA